ncbi:MAG TPA: methyltransferase [Steroidobacteraceae bacterium]|nr:methyltransferase [Steroidobacteraceae bacterium]
MKLPSLPHVVLLFFLGGVFLHFVQAGARTFHFKSGDAGPGASIAQGMFLFGGVIPIWFIGLYQPIHLANGTIAAVILVASIALYEWARAAIWGRRFGIALGEHVPEQLCEAGPYRRIRHPIYLAYMLAYLAALVALPHWLLAALLVANVVLFTLAARDDERTITTSALAPDYAAYRQRAGMFWPM